MVREWLCPWHAITTGAMIFELGLAAIGLAIAQVVPAAPLALGLGISLSDIGLSVAATLPPLGLLLATWVVPIAPLRHLWEILDRTALPLLRPLPWFQLAVISASAGLGEEVLFRGVIQTSISHWLPDTTPWVGIAAGAILFGLVHPLSVTYVLWATMAGGYFGWLLAVTENLWIPILVHAFYDFVALLLLTRCSMPRRSSLDGPPS